LTGKIFPGLSEKFYKWFGHRSLTHSAYFVIGLMIVAFIFPDNPLVYAFIIGYVSHLLIDLYTPSGVQLFYPLNYSFTIFDGGI